MDDFNPTGWGYQEGKRAEELHVATLQKMATEDQAEQLKIKATEQSLQENDAFITAIKNGSLGNAGQPQQGAPGQPAQPGPDAPAILNSMGMTALSVGLVDKGSKLLSAASTMETQQSLIDRRQARTRYDNANTLANLYATVHDQQSWDLANQHYQLMTGQTAPDAANPYNPQDVEMAKASALSQKDKAAMDLAAAREKLVVSQAQTEEKRRTLIAAQTRVNQDRADALEHNGGKPVPQTFVTATANAISNAIDTEDLTSGQLKNIATPFAERVQSLVNSSQMTLSQATAKVVGDAVKNGELAGYDVKKNLQPGASRDRPFDLPLDKTGKIDASKMKPNKYYKGPEPGSAILVTPAGKYLLLKPDEEGVDSGGDNGSPDGEGDNSDEEGSGDEDTGAEQ